MPDEAQTPRDDGLAPPPPPPPPPTRHAGPPVAAAPPPPGLAAVDPKLRQLVRDAEAGKPCPPLRVLAGNQLFIGTPGRAGTLLDAMESEMQQSAWAEMQRNRELPRRIPEAQERFRASYTSPLSGQLKHVVDALIAPETEPVLTLTNVQWWPMAGDGLTVPGIRIPFGAITAWWISGGQTLKARAGTSWGFGVLFPIGE